MRILLVAALVLLSAPAVTAAAAAPTTGFEDSDGAELTTYEQEQGFLAAVAAGSPRARVSSIGQTKEGRSLDLVEVGAPGPRGAEAARSRPTALVVCSQHGNEPAGREACLKLLRDLAFSTDPGTVALLERTTFLFLPTANPDGRAADQRGNADGTDVNRDHVTLDTPEARAVARLIVDWEPDVLLDLHEYGPSQPVIYDDAVLWLWPRNLNADQAVHDLSIEIGRQYLVPSSEAAGYPADEYGQAEVLDNDVAQTAGDGDEGIMRNAMGLRHVLGLLVETRVDADVRQDLAEPTDQARVQRRRVDSHLAVLRGMQRFLAERGPEAAAVTAAAARRKAAEGASRGAPLYFGGADNEPPAPEDVVDPPPCGYRLTDAQLAQLGPRLDLLGILREGPFVSLAQRAEPIAPLLLDGRGQRAVVEAAALDRCPAATDGPSGGGDGGTGGRPGGGGTSPGGAGGTAAPAPAVQPGCDSTRTVAYRLPRVRGRVYRTRVVAGGRGARVRRGVAYVKLRRPNTTVRVVIRRRVLRDGRRRLVRQVRTVRVCPAR